MVPQRDLDRCDECGFIGDDWTDRDTEKTIGLLPAIVPLWMAPLADGERDRRPAQDTWSANEYVDHLRETLFAMRFVVDSALADDGVDLGPEIDPNPPGAHRSLDGAAVATAMAGEAKRLAGALKVVDGDGWGRSVVIGGRAATVRWAARHAVHDAWHHLTDIAGIAASLDRGVPTQTGSLVQINASTGGVPKDAVDVATITLGGVEGDVQANRTHHGRPWQALCLWSGDVIDALVAEGHPIAAGAAGENLTVAGVDWSTLHAGALVDVGDATCRLSAPAVPCAKNNRWFADGDSRRIDHDRHPGWSRWYAAVVSPGSVTAGDRVTVRRPG